ncbi:MAG: cobalt-precorrin-5B (C(1))-methyltransferase CbiD [Desulfotalea sp.]
MKKLRSGYTTGACAAVAAKAATMLISDIKFDKIVEIPFPDGSRHSFVISQQSQGEDWAKASTIKDAGDDPDVTNGAEISATVQKNKHPEPPENSVKFNNIILCGGAGVGRVTKAGLAILPGEPAINPVPRQMISDAITEVQVDTQDLIVTISVKDGLLLAEKTLNSRLGIVGGISILGTTGIVRPVSAQAWKDTISACMDVARSANIDEVVISTGRTSEKGVQKVLTLPEEAYAMMGDYLHFSLCEASKKGFQRIHYAGMWAKIMKAALRIPQTHVRNGALEIKKAAQLIDSLGAEEALNKQCYLANTAREMLSHLEKAKRNDIVENICQLAKEYAQEVSGCEVTIYLINHKSEIIYHA